MVEDHSFGVIPIRNQDGLYELYIVQHKQGYWSFPKGHALDLETALQTAKRELFEETGFLVERLIADTPLIEKYSFIKDNVPIHKTVEYFLAFVSGKEHLQQEEVIAGKWVHLEKADECITYDEGKALAQKVRAIIYALTSA